MKSVKLKLLSIVRLRTVLNILLLFLVLNIAILTLELIWDWSISTIFIMTYHSLFLLFFALTHALYNDMEIYQYQSNQLFFSTPKKPLLTSRFDEMNEGLWIIDKHFRTLIINSKISELLGYGRSEIKFHSILDFTENGIDLIRTVKDKRIDRIIFHSKTGSRIYTDVFAFWIHNNDHLEKTILILKDITRDTEEYNSIIHSLEENRLMLRETHHRVKNNLQIISSFIDLIFMESEEKDMGEIIKEIQTKIFAVAAIHTQLYKRDEYTIVHLQDLIKNLSYFLSNLYSNRNDFIEISIRADEIILPLNKAIPAMLIINEILTNAFKYAFAGMENGKITIILKTYEHGLIEIFIKDNGVGLPKGFDIDKINSLGLKLVKNVLENQLKGQMQINQDNGTSFFISFHS